MAAGAIRTANPALNENTFDNAYSATGSTTMTVEGTAAKTMLLLIIVVAAAAYPWHLFFRLLASESPQAAMNAVMPFLWGGLIGGLVFSLITIFSKSWVMFTAPIYAVCEGFLLGALSCLFEAQMPGIVPQAVGLTFGTLFCLLIVYRLGIVKVTAKFRAGVMAATGAIFLVYMVSLVMRLFGASMPFIHSAGPIGIGFSLFVVVIAALNLVLDFDFIERGARQGAPKWMEWYGAFGLLVTLVWLYLEILRLLSKLRRR